MVRYNVPMPTQKNKKRLFGHKKKPVLIAVVAVLALTLGWFLVVNPALNQRDKDRFLQAEVQLEQILEEKIRPAAEPDLVERERSCRYASRKYTDGPLSCTVTIHLAYIDASSEKSVDIIELISQKINSALRDGLSEVEDISAYEELDYFRLSQKINSIDGLSCSVGFTHPITLSSESLVFEGVSNDDAGLYTSLNCSDSARAEHFPV